MELDPDCPDRVLMLPKKVQLLCSQSLSYKKLKLSYDDIVIKAGRRPFLHGGEIDRHQQL